MIRIFTALKGFLLFLFTLHASLFTVTLCLATLLGCHDTSALPGKYIAELPGEVGQQVELKLEPNGQGSWTSEDDRISFKWELQAGKIHLHTKPGGVIEGVLRQDSIEFTVPGADSVVFKKVPLR